MNEVKSTSCHHGTTVSLGGDGVCKDCRIEELEARCMSLMEVLEFYADPETYFAIGFFSDPPCGSFMEDFEETGELGVKPGKRARKAIGWVP